MDAMTLLQLNGNDIIIFHTNSINVKRSVILFHRKLIMPVVESINQIIFILLEIALLQ